MSKIAVVTDSTGDIPEKLVQEYNLTVVPLNVHFGDDVYQDGVTMSAEQFFNRLRSSDILPRTSQPSPGDFLETYRKLKKEGAEAILSMHLSKELSGTYKSAAMAAKMAHDEEIDVRVFDTGSASMGIGVIVLEAARRAKAGEAVDDVLAASRHLARTISVYFAVDTLEYLERNGRIGKATRLLGGILKFKPILTLEDGFVAPYGRARGSKRAMKMLVETLQKDIPPGEKIRAAITHGDDIEKTNQLKGMIEERYEVIDGPIINYIGPVIGTHVGPGTLALIAHKAY